MLLFFKSSCCNDSLFVLLFEFSYFFSFSWFWAMVTLVLVTAHRNCISVYTQNEILSALSSKVSNKQKQQSIKKSTIYLFLIIHPYFIVGISLSSIAIFRCSLLHCSIHPSERLSNTRTSFCWVLASERCDFSLL